jgi:hypothetical protein
MPGAKYWLFADDIWLFIGEQYLPIDFCWRYASFVCNIVVIFNKLTVK